MNESNAECNVKCWNDGEFYRLYVSTRLESGSATSDVK